MTTASESLRENPVNQSGSVALSTEAMRGPPWRNSLIIMALLTQELRTRGSWVQVLPGAPNFKDLAAKTKSSFLLWDRCGTPYPLVRAASTEFKHLARKTRSSLLAVGPC